MKSATGERFSLRKSLRTRVTPVTSMLPVSLFSMFHCSVKSSTVFRSGFWMQAAVAKGCGRTPMALGILF